MFDTVTSLLPVLTDYYRFKFFPQLTLSRQIPKGDKVHSSLDQAAVVEDLEHDFNQAVDHWHFETSPFEQRRYQKLLDFARSVPHDSILEIGCAEGHFTKLLATISSDITALDVSPTALRRAKKTEPSATYHLSAIQDFRSRKHYDLIVCAEILYYIVDPQQRHRAIQKMRTMGRVLLTSHSLLWGLGSRTEASLEVLPPMRRQLLMGMNEKKMTMVSLWKLQG